MTNQRPVRVSLSMRKNARRYALMAAIVAVLSGCSPIFAFRTSDKRPEEDRVRLQERLRNLVEARGFHSIGFADRATGDIGCGRSAPDRTTFEKEWRGAGLLASHQRVWVHGFSCKGVWHVVIVSSRNADREAANLRDGISEEFGPEIAAGGLHFDTRCRLALE